MYTSTVWRKVQSLGLVQRHTAVYTSMFLPSLTVYMEEGPESWVSTTSYRQCTHPRMFLPSLTVYMEEGPESWCFYHLSQSTWRKVQVLG